MAAIGAAMCATALLFSATAQAQAPSPAQTASGTRLVLLGTAGGPSIKKARAQPSNALIVNGEVYVIDTGNGVARQMALAGIDAKKLRACPRTQPFGTTWPTTAPCCCAQRRAD